MDYKPNTENIPITMDNFEELSKKYKPVILSSILIILKMNSRYPQIERDDLYQVALMALAKSIEGYDETKSYFGVYLKKAILNSLKCYCRDFLPHRYVKDKEKTQEKGKSIFKRMEIQVGSIEDTTSFLF